MRRNKPAFAKLMSVMMFFVIVVMFFLYGRLVFLAVSPTIDGIDIVEFAKQRNTANIKLPAKRGNIYDREGLNLATSVSAYTVIAFLDENRTVNQNHPQHVVDKKKTAEVLGPVLNMSEEYIFGLLNRKGYQVELGPGGRDISEAKKREIESLKLPGISFIVKPKRHYPNGDFASYVIGYAKRYEEMVNDDGINRIIYKIVGELGIEGKYNEMLNGIDGSLIFQRDRFGYKIPDTSETRIDAVDGKDIYLTIDSGIQRFLEDAVKDVNQVYHPEWFQISVMEAKTGRILGSATTPSYNPNLLNIKNYENPLTTFSFEPGSTMKTYTYMCALEHGIYDQSKLVQSGKIKVFDAVITDWYLPGWGMIGFDEGFRRSSNVVAYNLVKSLKPYQLQDCFFKYGFGKKTDVELPREVAGSLPFINEVEKSNAAFGQGLSTTAIQHLQGLTIIANDGYMLKPYVIEKVYDPNTNELIFQSEIKKEKIVDIEVTNYMRKLLYDVTYGEGGTGSRYRVADFEVLGKTGTAQIFNNQLGRYETGSNDYVFSFTGMFPADDPEIIIYSAIKKPQHGRSNPMAFATKQVIENIGKYLNMGYEKEISDNLTIVDVPNYVNRYLEDVVKDLAETKIDVIILGDGNKIIKQSPSGGQLLTGDRLYLLTEGENILMPCFKGYSRREVMNFVDLTNLKVNFDGFGYIFSQSISEGTLVDKKMVLDLELTAKEL